MGFGTEAYTVVDRTIASSGTTTDAIDTLGYTWLAVELPGTLTSTAMAVHGCRTKDGTFKALYDSGGAISETVAADRIVIFGEVALTRYIKLVAGSSEGAERALVVYLKG